MSSNLTAVEMWRIFRIFFIAMIYNFLLLIASCVWGCFFMIKFGISPILSFVLSFAFFSILCAGSFFMISSRIGEVLLKVESKEILVIHGIVDFIHAMKRLIYSLCFLVIIMVSALSIFSEFQYIFYAILTCLGIVFSMKPVFGSIMDEEKKIRS